MKAPVPPPTMPRRIRRAPVSAMSSPLPIESENFAIGRKVSARRSKIVERLLGHIDDVRRDKRRALRGALLRRLDGALPLEHGPAVESILAQLREDRREIDLPIAQRAKAASAVHPALEAAIDALPAGRIELRVLDVEHPDSVVVNVDVVEIVELLQDEVARVVEQVRARVVLHPLEEHFVGDAVVEVLRRKDHCLIYSSDAAKDMK